MSRIETLMANKNKAVRRRKGVDVVQETIFKWENLNTIKKDIKKSKWSLGHKKKGCMKGKGGPGNSSHRFRGVRQRIWGKWVAEIREPKCDELDDYVAKRVWLGSFNNAVDAAEAYDQAAKAIYGDTAILNFPESNQGFREVLNVMKEENLETEKKGHVVECVEECVKEGNVDGIEENDDMRLRDFRAGMEGLRQEISMDVKGVEATKNLDFDFLRELLMEDFNAMEHLVMYDQDLQGTRKESCGNCEDLQQERLSDQNRTLDLTDASQNLVKGDNKNCVGEFENVDCNDEIDESWNFLSRYKDYIKELRRLVKVDEIDGSQNLLTGDMGYVEEHKKFIFTGESRNLLTGDTDNVEEPKALDCAEETDEIRNLLTGDTDFVEEFKKLVYTDEADASRNLLTEDVDYREELKKLFCTDEIDASWDLLAEDVDYTEELKKLFCTDETDESQSLLAGDTGYIEEPKKVDRTDEYNEQGDGKIDLNHLDWYNDDPLMFTEKSLEIPCNSNPDDELYIESLWSE